MTTANIANELLDELIDTDDTKDGNMILGDRVRIRHEGTIRPGTKVPVASCSDKQKALYNQLNAKGIDFDTINAEMLKLGGNGNASAKSVLRPVNIDYFVIRDCDFKNPKHAEYIRDNYADEDGKVRRIPIMFPTNDIMTAIPHNFVAFDGAHNVRCFSFYDGDDLKFKYLPKGFKDNPKPENWLVLDSEDEDEATKVCGYKVGFSGRYQFYIPGVASVGEVVLPTGSWYGLGDAVAVLKRVRTVLGRFNGTFKEKSFLVLEKVKQKVKAPDGKRQDQWVVTVNVAVEMIELAAYAETKTSRGFAGLQLLNGGIKSSPSVLEPPTASKPAKETVVKPAIAEKQPEKAIEPVKQEQKVAESPASEQTPSVDPQLQEAVERILTLGKENDLTEIETKAYANFKIGKDITKETDINMLVKLYTELKSRLSKDKIAVKKTINEKILKSSSTGKNNSEQAPEIEGMFEEFKRLADTYDILPEHMTAHIIALSGGVAPEDMTLEYLQTTYREVEARLKRGNVEGFKTEVAGNYNELYKKAA